MNALQKIIIKIFRIKQEPVYTLKVADLNAQTSERASGRSVRLADAYIQLLFKTGVIIVHDHHNQPHANSRLADFIFKRLQIEHGRELFSIRQNKIEIVDHSNFQKWKRNGCKPQD